MTPVRNHHLCLNRAVLAAALLLGAYVTPFGSLGAAESGNDKSIDPNVVLATKGEAQISQVEIDAAFDRIPERDRLVFIRSGERVDQLVRTLFEARIIAADAEANGLLDDPIVYARMQMAAERELARAWSDRLPSKAPEADYEVMARERYLAHPKEFEREVNLDLTQILIGIEDRDPEEARTIAMDLHARLQQEPETFQRLVAEYSDDDTKLTTFGRLEGVRKGQMVKPFEEAAFALEQEGQITEPVFTQYGYHLIRLDRRHSAGIPPFEEIREKAVAREKRDHQQAYVQRYIGQLLQDPIQFPEGSIEIMARRWFGEDLEKAPIFTEDGIQTANPD